MAEAIGVFDSGIGGLTVASAIQQALPNHRIIYFGDTLHLPYGDKSSKNIQKYIKAISAFLYEMRCRHLVVACNSASSVLSSVNSMPEFSSITNVINPVVDKVAMNMGIKSVGIIGTKRTIHSKVYSNLLQEKRSDLNIYELATPLLAPMIEEGFVHNAITEQVIHEYLQKLPKVDALILGCTHYPLIKTEINRFFDGKVQLFDAPKLVAQHVVNCVSERNTVRDSEDCFYVSDLTNSFEKTAQLFFGHSIHLRKSDLFEL